MAVTRSRPARLERRSGFEGFDIVRALLAIFLPPVGVFLQVGFGMHFWLNILLTILGWIPGVIHAMYVIFTR